MSEIPIKEGLIYAESKGYDDSANPTCNELLLHRTTEHTTTKTNKSPTRTHKAKRSECKSPLLLYCGLCHAKFGRQDHLKRHIECLHSSLTFCKCPVCEKQYVTEAAVKKHMTSHGQGSIYRCRVCKTAFNCFTALSQHEATHLVTRHKCPKCDRQFKRRDHMLRHVKSQHLMLHEVCVHCGLTLKRRDHLTRHLKEKHSFDVPVLETESMSSFTMFVETGMD